MHFQYEVKLLLIFNCAHWRNRVVAANIYLLLYCVLFTSDFAGLYLRVIIAFMTLLKCIYALHRPISLFFPLWYWSILLVTSSKWIFCPLFHSGIVMHSVTRNGHKDMIKKPVKVYKFLLYITIFVITCPYMYF